MRGCAKSSSGLPGAPTYLQSVQDLRIGGMVSAAAYQYTLRSDNLADLNAWAPRVLEQALRLPQLVDVNSDQQNKGNQAMVEIDRPTASRLGISAQLIDDTLYGAFGQDQVAINYTTLNQYHVVMEFAPPFWQTARNTARRLRSLCHRGHGAVERVHQIQAA